MKQAFNARNRETLSDRVFDYLKKHPGKKFTYGELAEVFDTAPMAVGQALKAIANRPGGEKITHRVSRSERWSESNAA